MAQTTPELLSKLAGRGEEALKQVASASYTQRLMESVSSALNGIDDLQKRVTGVERLEQRVAALEKKVAALGKPTTARAKPSSAKPSSAKASTPKS